MTPVEAEEQARGYLRYVRRAGAELKLRGSHLDKRYHPTEAALLKLVYARTPAEAEALKQAYRKLTAPAA